MRYLGGKSRIAGWVADHIREAILPEHELYIEPFVGSAAVVATLHDLTIPRLASDAQLDLILMFQALQEGWIPPNTVTEEEYAQLKYAPPSALRGFVGFGCSFAGRFFQSYARGEGRNYAKETANSLIKQAPKLSGVTFSHLSYLHLNPTKPSIIYCDPPYAASKSDGGYTRSIMAVPPFSPSEFHNMVKTWAVAGHTVLFSEYSAPDTFTCIAEREVIKTVRASSDNGKNSVAKERIYTYIPAEPVSIPVLLPDLTEYEQLTLV